MADFFANEDVPASAVDAAPGDRINGSN